MEVAKTLRNARKAAGLSQRELARRADMPQPAVVRIEKGRVTPRVDTLGRLLAACGVELSTDHRPGAGVDRTVIRQLLKLSPRERLELAVTEARNLERLLAARP